MVRRALVAILAVVLLAACDDAADEPAAGPGSSSSAPSTRASTTSPPTDPGPVVECPTDIGLDPDPALPDAVPEGATSVRLCEAAPGEVTSPADALTSDVDAVVHAVNAQRVVTRGCADRQLPAYQLAFGYPDGTRFVVAGRFTGCAELLVGSVRRLDAMPPLQDFVRALRAQRTGTTPDGPRPDSADLRCDQPAPSWTWQLARPPEMTVAVLCWGDPGHPDQAGRVVVPRGELRTLVASMRKDRVSTYGALGCTYFQRNDHWIVGRNAWGDPVVMERGCGDLAVAPNFDWDPRGEARQIVRRLIDKAR